MPFNAVLEHQGLRTKQNSKRTKGTSRSSQRIRSKFFQTIGICSNHTPQHISVATRSVRDLLYMPRFSEQLQYDHNEERLRREQRRSRQSVSSAAYDDKSSSAVSGKATKKKQVNFQESVIVAPIPMRGEYSDRIRSKLWSDAVEIHENIERNLVEFAAENRDWRRACLEDKMYTCGITGELIHPVHVETKQYVFGSGKKGSQQSFPVGGFEQRYWDAQDVI
eukprot:CAMPEP_0172320698 /NCGR_PEP_ID=MMETSP1058-20130122/41184_1 /TAXON_ID=83371 /ORGANISM="Detonula confervacea, Strain CCMP 353" /LENGTH=221 /DNA_ID=CAMNT_0013036015 /DNA_START=194 /DNA_END=859 /DNA_ORIENTATION=+